ncbi:hypothetical protein [Neorhizobium sp. T6_25]|uniref:DUF7940 domain-containing protein n=1 Tax=Neorhizobium sp. T6_25 TaxID=2093833 RepID=UPI000CF9EC5D|nr:hypothetical protein [Neorhizobium sp. T6_25]
MKFVADWRRVLRRAWSIRLLIIAGILSGIELVLSLPDIQLWLDWPPGIFAALSFLATCCAFVARLLVQQEPVHADKQDPQQ